MILNFKIIGPLVLEKKIFKVFTIYGHGGHLGHVTLLICINVHSHAPISFHMKFVLNDSTVSENKRAKMGLSRSPEFMGVVVAHTNCMCSRSSV